ncbi:MAG: hypothetical protein JKY43_01355 [Phycisphaerales bacterium]|nr:hypothetical protein [Phycisphaerales bacterium]
MALRLGDLLVQYGVLTPDQCELVVKEQQTNPRPFGMLAEELFGVDPGVIEHAWAAQFAMISPRLDPCTIELDEELQSVITNRQAWQFGFIPVERLHDGIVCVTSVECLARALRFVGWRLDEPCSFVICEHHLLEVGLSMHYPMEGADSGMMDRLISRSPAA